MTTAFTRRSLLFGSGSLIAVAQGLKPVLFAVIISCWESRISTAASTGSTSVWACMQQSAESIRTGTLNALLSLGAGHYLEIIGIGNVHKKLLIQAAACNLALLMRSLHGAGKSRAAHDRTMKAVFAILAFLSAMDASWPPWSVNITRHNCHAHR